MDKEFKETTIGKVLDRFANTGEMGTMAHSLETKTIVLMGVAIIIAGVVILAIKKYIFK